MGATWHLSCGQSARPNDGQTHEESTALKTLPQRFEPIGMGIAIQHRCKIRVLLFGERSFLGPNCRTKKEKTEE